MKNKKNERYLYGRRLKAIPGGHFRLSDATQPVILTSFSILLIF